MKRMAPVAILISVVAVAARLIMIDQPYIDNWSWRQSDVAAIARNYFDGGFHFAHPQIDWAGDQPGYVGTEFPVLPFLAALCYKIFGVHEWVGRGQALILFALSLPFFFLLARGLLGTTAATWALIFYSFAPLNVFAGREFIPDVPSLSLAIVGLYFFVRGLESELATGRVRPVGGPERRTRSTHLRQGYGGQASLFASAVLISLAILIKAPTAIIGAPIACLAFRRFGFSALRRPELWIFAAIVLIPAAIWYVHAYRVAQQFYPHHFFGAGGIQIMSGAWYWKIAKQTTSGLTPLLLVLAIAGLFMIRGARVSLFGWWLGAMILFIIIVGYGNRHPWYRLPLVPIAAVFAGGACAFVALGISSRAAKIALSILLASAFGILAFANVRPLYRSPSSAALRDLGLELKRVTAPGSLIVAADNGDPTVFYYAERKGWHLLEKNGVYEGEPTESGQAIVDLEQLRIRGASYLVFTSTTSWWLDYYREFAQHVDATASLTSASPEFKIYKLSPTTE